MNVEETLVSLRKTLVQEATRLNRINSPLRASGVYLALSHLTDAEQAVKN